MGEEVIEYQKDQEGTEKVIFHGERKQEEAIILYNRKFREKSGKISLHSFETKVRCWESEHLNMLYAQFHYGLGKSYNDDVRYQQV